MRLLVVTPTLGESRWLAETVASVAALSLPCVHLLVAPASRVAELAGRFPRCQVVPEPASGRGMYAAVNAGVAAGEDWDAFTYLNDDDLLSSPGFAMAQGVDADVTYGRVALVDGHGARLGGLPVARRGRDLSALLARGIMPLAQPGTIVRRRVWEKLGGFDESYRLAGDLDFFVRGLAAGFNFTFVDAPVAAFRLSRGQLSKQQGEMETETRRALLPLASAPRPAAALWRFRVDNLGVYFERLRRHGWVSMHELQNRTK